MSDEAKPQCETVLAVLKSETEAIKKDVATLCSSCDRCLIRKAVLWLIAVMGAAVVAALMALILRAPK
jgi:hypothetical protein